MCQINPKRCFVALLGGDLRGVFLPENGHRRAPRATPPGPALCPQLHRPMDTKTPTLPSPPFSLWRANVWVRGLGRGQFQAHRGLLFRLHLVQSALLPDWQGQGGSERGVASKGAKQRLGVARASSSLQICGFPEERSL